MKPVTVGSVFSGGPRKLGVGPQAPSATGQITPGVTPVAHQPGTSFAPHPPTGPAPQTLSMPGQSSPSTPGPSPASPSPPSPLDSTYFANVAANQFKVNNQINGLNTQGGLADTALQTTLGNLAYQEPRDQLKAEQAANSRGALYSTVYDQQLGDLTHGYQERQSAAQTSHDNGALQRAAQISALNGGVPLFNDQQAAAAAVRAANLNAANKALGEPSNPLVKTPPVAQSSTQQLASALAAAQQTGKTQTTHVDGQTISSFPTGLQQAAKTKGGMFGGTVRLPSGSLSGLARVAQLMGQGMTQAQAMKAIGAK